MDFLTRHLQKSLCAALLLCGMAFATGPARVTVGDTLYDPTGNLLNGTVVITNASAFTSPDGFVVSAFNRLTVKVTAGVFSVALVPNVGSSPSGTSYSITYDLLGYNYPSEIWVVPNTPGVAQNLNGVRTLTAPKPSVQFAASQLNPPSPCTANQVQQWTGTAWQCATVNGVGSGGYATIQNAAVAIAQRAILNWTADVLCADNAGAASSDCALKTVGTPGTYTKVTTDSKGRVTSGAALIKGDLPGVTVYSDQANTYGAGFKQTFTASASTAGFNIAPVTADPSSPQPGDGWFRGDLNHRRFRDNAGTPATHTLFNSDDTLPGAQVSGNISGNAAGLSANIAESQVTGLVADLSAKEVTANKDVASGYAGLDAGTKLKASEFPAPSTTTFGGVKSLTCTGTDKLSAIGTDGIPVCSAPPVTSVAGRTGAVTLASTDVGLSSVTNDVQTKAAIVPNTVPTAGQILVGNAGGTAYAPVSASGDATIASTGAVTVNKTNGTAFAASATTDATNATNIASGTLASARLPNPTVSAKGGVQAKDCTGTGHVLSINTDSTVTCSADSGGGSAVTEYATGGRTIGPTGWNNGQMRCSGMLQPVSVTFSNIQLYITTADASGSDLYDYGFYKNVAGTATLIARTGAVAYTSSGDQSHAIFGGGSATMPAGEIAVCYAANAVTAQRSEGGTLGCGWLGDQFVSSVTTLPSTFTWPTASRSCAQGQYTFILW